MVLEYEHCELQFRAFQRGSVVTAEMLRFMVSIVACDDHGLELADALGRVLLIYAL